MIMARKMKKGQSIDRMAKDFDKLKKKVNLSGRDAQWAAEELERARLCGAEIVTYPEFEYPKILSNMSSPPAYLYVRGDKSVLNYPLKTAILGSRHATLYGLNVAGNFAYELADNDVCVVSGGAVGIDTAALRGALRGRAPVICMVGAGVDVIYPKENEKLFDMVAERGAVVSQFPLKTPAFPNNFPVRNKVMAMLIDSMVIVEAAERSGALISAHCAMDAGKTVFAVPGNIDSPNSVGTNNLLKDGALVATSGSDVLFELMDRTPADYRKIREYVKKEEDEPAAPKAEQPKVSGPESAVINALKEGHHDYDSILEYCACEAKTLTSVLTLMEIKGMIRTARGGRYELL